ncbi:RNB domain-containing ribonuclease, partial [Helicobacter typhlonius]|uniref:RNB domain-containing ribonuclease n=1 Tax=Helicobacter typhlonius TaxID=76936 RepID=UPI002FDF84EC
MKYPLNYKDHFNATLLFWITRFIRYKLTTLSNHQVYDKENVLEAINLLSNDEILSIEALDSICKSVRKAGMIGINTYSTPLLKLYIFLTQSRIPALKKMEEIDEPLDKLAKILRKQRYENGSVDFDREEVRFDIDENGHPVSVFFKESKDANKLIEEFMLLANRTVAAEIGIPKQRKKPKAFVFRIHDAPDTTRLQDLATIARTFGYKLKTNGTPREINRSINKMLQDVKGKGEENLLSVLAIRSMAKAIYSTDNIGHYGLGFEYYTHFTSPIRRYP